MFENLGSILSQVQALQSLAGKLTAQMESKRVEVVVGQGLVTVTMSGKGEVCQIRIAPEALQTSKKNELESLLAEGVNQAIKKSRDMVQEELSKILNGLKHK